MSLYRGLVGRLAWVHGCALIFVTLAGVASASVSGRATHISIPSTRRGLDYSQAALIRRVFQPDPSCVQRRSRGGIHIISFITDPSV